MVNIKEITVLDSCEYCGYEFDDYDDFITHFVDNGLISDRSNKDKYYLEEGEYTDADIVEDVTIFFSHLIDRKCEECDSKLYLRNFCEVENSFKVGCECFKINISSTYPTVDSVTCYICGEEGGTVGYAAHLFGEHLQELCEKNNTLTYNPYHVLQRINRYFEGFVGDETDNLFVSTTVDSGSTDYSYTVKKKEPLNEYGDRGGNVYCFTFRIRNRIDVDEIAYKPQFFSEKEDEVRENIPDEVLDERKPVNYFN